VRFAVAMRSEKGGEAVCEVVDAGWTLLLRESENRSAGTEVASWRGYPRSESNTND